jgi:hypothetical protein
MRQVVGQVTVAAPYETFDIDLREGQAREDAFVHVLLRCQVEHKRDKKAGRTGNLAVELKQRCSDGVVRPSGVMATTAERWAVEYAPECWLVLPVESVRARAELADRRGMARWIGDGENHYNALVPIDWFVRPYRDIARPGDPGGAL